MTSVEAPPVGPSRPTPRQRDVNIDFGPAGPERGRGIELPQLLIALLLVALFALAAVWWMARATDRVPVLALANNVAAGQQLQPTDLTTIFVNTDRPESVRLVSEDFASSYLADDIVATHALEAGTLITPSMFGTTRPLGPGNALLGLVLSADQLPDSLVPNDPVKVILYTTQQPPAVVQQYDATIYEIARPSGNASSGQGAWRVVVEMAETESAETAVFASISQVALVEVQK